MSAISISNRVNSVNHAQGDAQSLKSSQRICVPIAKAARLSGVFSVKRQCDDSMRLTSDQADKAFQELWLR